jgi:hypothetical protein
MTTKEIKSAISIYQELTRTDKFKRSLDILLSSHPEIIIQVAPPFRCYKSEKGKCFKVKIKNVNTGKGRLICKTNTESISDKDVFFAKGCTYHGYTFEKLLDEKGIQSSDIVDCHVYAHTIEYVTDTYWGQIALQVSKLIESDAIHLEPCSKCNGAGILPHYFHVAEGLCFQCLGTKHSLVINEMAL